MTTLGVVLAGLTIFTSLMAITQSIYDSQEASKAQEKSQAIAEKSLETQTTIANQNFGLEKEQFEYQKQLNELQMRREDTAMQRQVADLKAAGLSPLMASGGSSTGQYLSASAPQMNSSGILSAMSNLLGVHSDYASRKQAAYQFERQQGLQVAQQIADLSGLKLQNENQRLQNKILQQQYDYNEKHGVRDPSPVNALVDYVMNYVDKNGLPSLQTVDEKLNEIKNQAKDVATEKLNYVKDYVNNEVIPNVKSTAKEYYVDPVVNTYKKAGEHTVSAGKKIWNSIKTGVSSAYNSIKNKWNNRKNKK